MKNKKSVLISVAIFIGMLISTSLIVVSYTQTQRADAIEKANYLIEAQVSELDRALSSYIQATDTLRILIVDSNGKINDFNRVAQELYNDDTAFRSIQLAPDGFVKYIYPLKGNEEGFGDLFADPDRRTEAEYARDSGKTTLAGPFELHQSGMGIVIRQPIYLTENNQKTFWGFSIVVLNIPEIFDTVHLSSLDNLGYNYQLWRLHPDTHTKQIIIGTEGTISEDSIQKSFQVPGSAWTLSLSPKDGWVPLKGLAPILIGTSCVTLLIPLLSYALLLINEQKKKMSEMSYRDYLTDLYNIRKMSQVLGNLCNGHRAFYFIYLDVNKFKQVNDTMGHAAGDALLKAIASRMLDCIKKEDYAFRIGGDEFALALLHTVQIEDFIHTLTAELSKELYLEGNSAYSPDVSIGYAHYPSDTTDAEVLISIADERMYRMKRCKK